MKSNLSHENKDTYSELGKWLKLSFGLHFIYADDFEECFFKEVMAEALPENRCCLFADYLIYNYMMRYNYKTKIYSFNISD